MQHGLGRRVYLFGPRTDPFLDRFIEKGRVIDPCPQRHEVYWSISTVRLEIHRRLGEQREAKT